MTQTGADTNRLFDREIPEDYQREWTARVAAPRKAVEVRRKSVIVFRIGPEWLALPTEIFQEVVDHYVVRTLPHQRGGILTGLVNVRGDLLLCVALEVLLGLEPEVHQKIKTTSHGRLLIAGRGAGRLAFRADEVYGVLRYHAGDLRDIPSTLTKASAGTYVTGVLPWNDQTVGCLDAELIFHALNRGLT